MILISTFQSAKNITSHQYKLNYSLSETCWDDIQPSAPHISAEAGAVVQRDTRSHWGQSGEERQNANLCEGKEGRRWPERMKGAQERR